MNQPTYSFCMSMLHSLWQGGLLWLLYLIIEKIFFQKISPLEKRNLLFLLLGAQIACTLITFSLYFYSPQTELSAVAIGEWVNRIIPSEQLVLAAPWLTILYLFIVGFKVIKGIYTWRHFKIQVTHGLIKAPVELKLFTTLKAHQFGIKRKIKLWLSTNIHTPVTFGFFKPVILLPVALLNHIELAQVETILLHELSHIKTNDYLLNWFLLFSETVFFFNPFVLAFGNKIRLEREKYCDISVMAFNYSPAIYAEALLKAERIKQLPGRFQLAAVNRKKQLFQRILFFTNSSATKKPGQGKFIISLISILLFFCLFSWMFMRFPGNKISENSRESDGKGTNPLEFIQPTLPLIGGAELKGLLINLKTVGPHIIKQVKKLQPLILSIKHKSVEIEKETTYNFAQAAASSENDATSQIIISEETSGSGSKSVKMYYLSFENGQWVLKPGWKAIAKKLKINTQPGYWDSTENQEAQ